MKWLQAGLIGAFALAGAGLAYWHAGPGQRADLPPVQVDVGDYAAFHDAGGSRVVLYTLASCPVCGVAKQTLDAYGVEYAERRLDDAPSLREDIRALGARSVPLMIAGRHKVEGFDRQAYREALEAESLVPADPR